MKRGQPSARGSLSVEAQFSCDRSGIIGAGMRCRCRRGSWGRRYEYEDPLKAAEREERDRRRAEVRRYPIDDTELHAELNKKASADGMPWTVQTLQKILLLAEWPDMAYSHCGVLCYPWLTESCMQSLGVSPPQIFCLHLA